MKLSGTLSKLYFCMENYKGDNSAKNEGGVTAVNLCTSSGHALYLCQVL